MLSMDFRFGDIPLDSTNYCTSACTHSDGLWQQLILHGNLLMNAIYQYESVLSMQFGNNHANSFGLQCLPVEWIRYWSAPVSSPGTSEERNSDT